MTEHHDVVVIGGGPAGMAAALGARESGIDDVLILERDDRLGGILNQCVHNGFGLHAFKEELTGPEYAERYARRVREAEIPYRLNTTVIDISPQKEVLCISRETGITGIAATAIVLAMGCRERPRGALGLPGFRQAGVYSAGTAQRLMNIDGYLVGKEVVILGSGDIGLIMARRMTLEGATVKVVAEIMPYSGGLKRNITQCLDDFGIPLKLSHTITKIHGRDRVSGVTIAAVDENREPIPGTEEFYSCDTVLLSCGLLPENELSKSAGIRMDAVTGGAEVTDSFETSLPGVFSCGNVLHVHDLVDYVSEEAERAGKNAAEFVRKGKERRKADFIPVKGGDGVRYTVPQYIDGNPADDIVTMRFRVTRVFRDKVLAVYFDERKVRGIKKKLMTPGKMEEISIAKQSIEENMPVGTITICVESE